MLRKPDLYNKAIALRRKGFSYNEILERIPVAGGTISRWCHNIPLTKKQTERLIEKKRNTPLIRQLREQAAQSKREAKFWAREKANEISSKLEEDKLLSIMGSMLYWAEGTKRDVYKGVEFVNTDANMILLMMRFFKEILNVPEANFRIMVRIGKGGNVKEAEKYWSELIKIPKNQFNKPELLNLKKNSKSFKKHPYGMCRVVVHNVSMTRKLMALINELSRKILSP